MDLRDTNVILVTLDCCRFDSVERAYVPFLRRMGNIRRAESYATFTLPAHYSIFCGYLPRVVEGPPMPYYSRGEKTLWRLHSARPKPGKDVELLLTGDTIVDGYRRLGFHTVGAGGVRWFRSPLLQGLFEQFFFWGSLDNDVFQERNAAEFALNHIDEIADAVWRYPRWFLFVNAQETHVPYDIGDGHPARVREAVERARPLWGGKRHNACLAPATSEDFDLLHRAQIAALERVDRGLEALVQSLSGPKLLVVCGDHGEAFGEQGLYGHGFPAREVFDVPLLVSVVER